MDYKEYIFLPNLSGSGYLSPILEIQGGQIPLAGKVPVPWDGIIQGLSLSPLHCKTPTSIP